MASGNDLAESVHSRDLILMTETCSVQWNDCTAALVCCSQTDRSLDQLGRSLVGIHRVGASMADCHDASHKKVHIRLAVLERKVSRLVGRLALDPGCRHMDQVGRTCPSSVVPLDMHKNSSLEDPVRTLRCQEKVQAH